MSEEIRKQKQRDCELVCLRCQKEYQESEPYDISLVLLRELCTTCKNGIRLKQLDSPRNRGRVGNWQPW